MIFDNNLLAINKFSNISTIVAAAFSFKLLIVNLLYNEILDILYDYINDYFLFRRLEPDI